MSMTSAIHIDGSLEMKSEEARAIIQNLGLKGAVRFYRQKNNELSRQIGEGLLVRIIEGYAGGFKTPARPATDSGTLTPTANDDSGRSFNVQAMPDGEPRALWHKRQIYRALAAGITQPHGERHLYMTGGGGGAGKTTVVRYRQELGLTPSAGLVAINADRFKMGDISEEQPDPCLRVDGIPEYLQKVEERDPRGAAMVHEESAYMAKKAFRLALATGTDILHDSTMSEPKSALALMEQAWNAGYKVEVIGVTTDPVEAVRRSGVRYVRTGRFVHPRCLLYDTKYFATYFELESEGFMQPRPVGRYQNMGSAWC